MSEPSVETVDRLRVAVMRLARELRLEVREESLSPSESSVLATLVRCGTTRAGELAAKERLHPTLLSRTLAALEERELVVRKPAADDRRVSEVTATPAGKRLVTRLRSARSRRLAQLLGDLPEGDVDRLLAALPALELLAGVVA